jgi:hypothetical protein
MYIDAGFVFHSAALKKAQIQSRQGGLHYYSLYFPQRKTLRIAAAPAFVPL